MVYIFGISECVLCVYTCNFAYMSACILMHSACIITEAVNFMETYRTRQVYIPSTAHFHSAHIIQECNPYLSILLHLKSLLRFLRNLSIPYHKCVCDSKTVEPWSHLPGPIIEPGQEIGDWDRGDPRYSALVQQVVGKIETQAPSGDAATGHHVSG